MFSPQMLNPAVMSFFKQAGEAFQQTVEAEASGRMARALEKHCGSPYPPNPGDPAFFNRCLLYAAKAYAMAHIDGQVTWGGVKEVLDASSLWPPAPELQAQGALFQSFMLGFLYGSELPAEKHQAIEGMIPMASRIAADPMGIAQSLGLNPEQMRQMAEQAGKSGSAGLGNLMNMFNPGKDKP